MEISNKTSGAATFRYSKIRRISLCIYKHIPLLDNCKKKILRQSQYRTSIFTPLEIEIINQRVVALLNPYIFIHLGYIYSNYLIKLFQELTDPLKSKTSLTNNEYLKRFTASKTLAINDFENFVGIKFKIKQINLLDFLCSFLYSTCLHEIVEDHDPEKLYLLLIFSKNFYCKLLEKLARDFLTPEGINLN